MKKLRKKVSFLTKIYLVISILFSNLISLTNVFALEVEDDLQITINETEINVKYTNELDTEEDSVHVKLVENYTYLDGTYDQNEEEITSLVSDLTGDSGINLPTMLQNISFDGLYEAQIEVYTGDTQEDFKSLLKGNVSKKIELKEGLELKVYNTLNEEVPKVNGVYNIDSGFTIKYRFLSGGLVPKKTYNYKESEMTSEELINNEFTIEVDLTGYLYGEHTLELNESLIDTETEEVINYQLNEKFMYKTYDDNSIELNDSATNKNLDTVFKFETKEKDGTLFVYSDGTEHNVSELLSVLENYIEKNEKILTRNYIEENKITLAILDGDNNILESYEKYLEELSEEELENAKSREEFYKEIELKDDIIVKLSDKDSYITFKVMYVGDIDGNGIVDSEDLKELINQVIEISSPNLDKFDMVSDNKLDLKDIIYFNEVINNNNNWNIELGTEIGSIQAALQLENDEVVTGDEFKVLYLINTENYQVNGIEALVTYDETKFELVSINNETSWIGNYNNNKILYIGNDYLDANGEYSLFSITFKALSSGTGEINVENSTAVSKVDILSIDDKTIEVIVNASSDNSLASLKIGNTVVELEENTLDYTVTVESYVENLDIEALANNIGANVRVDAPEELAYGENKVTITVTAENGNEKIYTITVIREEEKPVVTQTTYTYNEEDNTNTGNNIEPIVTEPTKQEEPVEEENSVLSKIIIIVLILIVIAGLVYLIFKDDKDVKDTNKEINKFKTKDIDIEEKPIVKTKTNNKPKNTKNKTTNKTKKN